MSKQVFINLPAADLAASVRFYTALGFANNPQFSNETNKCMVWSEHIFLMLYTHEQFQSFTTKPLADTKSASAAMFSLSMDSVDEMNEFLANGLKAGGTELKELRDYGFMQQRTLEDPDGHTWEVFYLDMAQFPAG